MSSQLGAPATVMVRPLLLKPQWMNGLSERLLVSHYENNYGGALRRLNAIAEKLESLDFAAVGLDATGDRDCGQRGEDRRYQHDALPQSRIGAKDTLRDAADQLPPQRTEDDEHEEVDGRHLTAHFVRRDSLDGGVLWNSGR